MEISGNSIEYEMPQCFKLQDYVALWLLTFLIVISSSSLCLPWVNKILDAANLLPKITVKQIGNFLFKK